MNKVYNRIESITGNVITVRANDVKYKELAQINTRFEPSKRVVGNKNIFPFGVQTLSVDELYVAFYVKPLKHLVCKLHINGTIAELKDTVKLILMNYLF